MIDFELYGDGPMVTVYRLTPLTDAAKEWVEENVSPDGFHPEWPTLHIEHGYIDALLSGIELAGMSIEGNLRGAVVALGRGADNG